MGPHLLYFLFVQPSYLPEKAVLDLAPASASKLLFNVFPVLAVLIDESNEFEIFLESPF
jgi:hypothetical protein